MICVINKQQLYVVMANLGYLRQAGAHLPIGQNAEQLLRNERPLPKWRTQSG